MSRHDYLIIGGNMTADVAALVRSSRPSRQTTRLAKNTTATRRITG